MAQFGRPSADTSIGNWTDEAGGTTNIYTGIDEISAEDVEYIRSELNPTNSPYATALTTLEDPVSSSGHIYRVREQKSAAGGGQIDATYEIRQGYVNEGTPGTLISTDSSTDVGSAWTTQAFTLSGAEADAITDYTDLAMRFVANQST